MALCMASRQHIQQACGSFKGSGGQTRRKALRRRSVTGRVDPPRHVVGGTSHLAQAWAASLTLRCMGAGQGAGPPLGGKALEAELANFPRALGIIIILADQGPPHRATYALAHRCCLSPVPE